MVRVAVALMMLLIVLLPSASWAQGEKRIALLIGNQGYPTEVGSLKNPHKDVELMARSLKQVGFEVLPLVKEARRSAMLGAVRGLVARLNAVGAGAVGFLYYSGHGAAESATGVNYLIPIDATSPDSAEFWDQSLKLDDVLLLLENANQAAHFVVFDACRNELKLSQKSTNKGFIPVAEQAGKFIAYAAAPGKPASDVGEKSGPYAAALASELVKAGQHHLDLFQNVKEAVANESAGKQEPWERNGLLRRVYFAGTDITKPPLPPPPPPVHPQMSEAERIWGTIKDTTSRPILEAFIQHYGSTFFGALARARLEELRDKQKSPNIPPQSHAQPTTPTKESLLPSLVDQTIGVVLPKSPVSSAPCSDFETLVGNERRCLKPKEGFKDCSECPEMVVVPSSEFIMGSNDGEADEKPMHKVTIARPFAVGKFEVTFAEWDACVAAGGCGHNPGDSGWGRGKRPVINVSWDDITNEYVPWLTRKTGKPYRLLTEAEWEYAARGVTTASSVHIKYAWGSDIGKNRANCNGCGSRWDNKRTAPVGSFTANLFGLYDMFGNASEWVQDCYTNNYAGSPSDGRARSDVASCRRAVRGGAWDDNSNKLRAAYRDWDHPGLRINSNGFRVARTLE